MKAALALFLVASAAAGGGAHADERDDEVFEEDPIAPAAPPDVGEDEEEGRDEDVFGEGEDADLGAKAARQDDPLAIGGQLYLRLDAAAPDDAVPGEWNLQSPGLLDVYLDARPNDRVRAYVRGRLAHDPTVDEDAEPSAPPGGLAAFAARERTRVLLDQLWLKLDLARRVFVTAGRQPVRWGSGRFWNPTDVLSAGFRNPLEPFDVRLGTSLVKVHVPVESLGWNFYALANLEGASDPEDAGGALRAEVLVGPAEIAAVAAAKRSRPTTLGLDVSSPVGPVDLRAEGAALVRDDRTAYRAMFGLELGLRVFEDDTLYVGFEAFHQNDGGGSLEDYKNRFLAGEPIIPLYLGREYAGVYAYLPGPGRLDDHRFVLTALANLSDRSGLVRFDYSLTALTHLRFNAYVMVHAGEEGELHLPTQAFESGLGLTLSI